MSTCIPLYDLARGHAAVAEELASVFQRVLRSGRFVLGPELETFEVELGRYLGVRHVVGVNSGSDAIAVGLLASGIGPGDEVITTPFTFFATAEAVLRTGARPVFVDIEPETFCLDPDGCVRGVTERTRAILLVHVFGHCGLLDRFLEICDRHRLRLFEDAAQAIGSSWCGRKLGSLGCTSTFSFYPTKNLGALGDAGAIATDDPELASACRALRNHGRNGQGKHLHSGFNSKLDEIQAAFLRVKLAGLDAENERRRVLASRYDHDLAGLVRPIHGADGCCPNYHQYAIATPQRDRLANHLSKHGIETGSYYRTPLHLHPAFGPGRPALPVAEQASQEVLTLPVRPSLTDAEQARIVGLIKDCLGYQGSKVQGS